MTNTIKIWWIISGLALVINGCVATATKSTGGIETMNNSPSPPDSTLEYSVFLLGDAGDASLDPIEPTLAVLQKQLAQADPHSSVVFLGDNLYPNGLPPADSAIRDEAEKHLLAQLQTVKNFPGNVLFIPGNHDWKSSQKGGLETLKRQETYIEQYLNQGNVFLPDNGKPGPATVKLDGQNGFTLKIIALDTQWWKHEFNKPYRDEQAAAKESMLSDLKVELSDSIADQTLVVGHHPVYSKGPHGGNFPLKTHLLPPLGGSLYVLYRNEFGTHQDVTNSQLQKELADLFTNYDPLIYASGHDHSLQYLTFDDERRNQHYIVSGSASEISYAADTDPPSFSAQQKGFAKLNYYQNSIWLEFWNANGIKTFNQKIADF